ncbi:hypothetical protein V6N11_076537 [Hibiscus sabdariffa]|uniref:Uncharacterized protein n=1 Tax=Hibiscus sabdariffa TaxID=183260 RepID=A0ABR2Q6K6_9ROSI
MSLFLTLLFLDPVELSGLDSYHIKARQLKYREQFEDGSSRGHDALQHEEWPGEAVLEVCESQRLAASEGLHILEVSLWGRWILNDAPGVTFGGL